LFFHPTARSTPGGPVGIAAWYARSVKSDWGFGIVRTTEGPDTRALFDELCTLASGVAGVRLTPYIGTDYSELVGALEDGALGLAWLPPIPTIDVDGEVGSVLAIPARAGSTSYHAALVVRRGGPKALADLKGRRAAWVQRDSSSGYLVPRMHLAAQGFDVLRFFARELFVHSHSAVVDAVSNGEADVGATYCHVDATSRVVSAPWLDREGKINRPVEALVTIGPIPNDALVANAELPATARSAVARWLLAPDARARELFARLLDAKDFRVPAPDHYDALRHAVRAARARGHDALPPESRRRIRAGR
jgi:phosphonate transport system substrate-binding protein